MLHIISIPKRDYTRGKTDRLLLALSVMERARTSGLAMDSSGDFHEIFIANSTRERVEQLKYFAIGFLNAPELE